jgi:hypothetical protein
MVVKQSLVLTQLWKLGSADSWTAAMRQLKRVSPHEVRVGIE